MIHKETKHGGGDIVSHLLDSGWTVILGSMSCPILGQSMIATRIYSWHKAVITRTSRQNAFDL